MEHSTDLLCSLELAKEWAIPLAQGKLNSCQGYQHDLLHPGSHWTSSPEFGFPYLDGTWVTALVKGEHCVYVKKDGSLQQTKLKYNSGNNSGAWQVVLIHQYESELARETGVEPPVSAAMWDAQNRVLLKKTELDVNLCDYSYPRQVIRSHVFYSNFSLITFPLRFRVSVTLKDVQPDEALEPWLHQHKVKDRQLEEVNKQLADLLLSSAVHDVEFVFEDQGVKLYGHRDLLSAASPVFASMLASTMSKDHDMKIVPIDDSSVEGFRHFLRYIYARRVDKDTLKEHVDELLSLSDKYRIDTLKKDCTNYLLHAPLTFDNCIDLYVTADKFHVGDMKSKTFSFMQSHAVELTSSDKWRDLTRKDQALALELAVRMLQEQSSRLRPTSSLSPQGGGREHSCSESTAYSD